MKSAAHGKSTSSVEVTNISPTGFWLLLDGRELLLPFAKFPWFRQAQIEQLCDVEMPSPGHLYWPKLDIDISVDSIDHPECYPLTSQAKASQVAEKLP